MIKRMGMMPKRRVPVKSHHQKVIGKKVAVKTGG